MPRFACFHAQQAAEKTLKAAIVFLGQRPSRSHDLDELVGRLPADWQAKIHYQQLRVLTEWAERSRYPGDQPDATEGDGQFAVRQTRLVWESVTADLALRGFEVETELR